MTLMSHYRQKRKKKEEALLRSDAHCQLPGFFFKQGTFRSPKYSATPLGKHPIQQVLLPSTPVFMVAGTKLHR